jgi:TPP-dependent pyruvate/acetoin dehydrogenase alpha subunit
MRAAGELDDATMQRLQAEADTVADEAARFADESPQPPRESLMRDIYAPADGAKPDA